LSAIRPSKSVFLTFDEIDFPTTSRAYNATGVAALVQSIRAIGLMVPLTVVERDGRYLLIAGRHRLEALHVIGEERVPARVVDFDDIEARLWTISENLHRTELSAVHRSEQIAEFARLVKERQEGAQLGEKVPPAAHEGVSAQVAQKPQGGRPEGGDSLAARELGITREEVRRSQAIAALPDEVKAKAADLGLDRNQSALLQAAKAPTPQAQLETLEQRADRAAVPIAPRPPALRNLEYLAAGEFARWIRITTPNDRPHIIRMLRMAADILEDELEGIANGPSKANGARQTATATP
jgi:uncharacterized ParB-like nuclease family protein